MLRTFCASRIISKSVRVFYLGLSPFVKPMFWLSLLANEITGNFISSSGCGPDCPMCQVTFSTLGFRLRMRCTQPKVRESSGTLSWRSNACKQLARLPRVCRTSLGRFRRARKLLELWASAFRLRTKVRECSGHIQFAI